MNNLSHATLAPVIAIDGPSSSGKGTVSQLLAKRINWHFLDSGAIYRVLALAVGNERISPDEPAAIAQLASILNVKFRSFIDPGSSQVILDGRDVTDEIRTPQCGSCASQISVFPEVRQALLGRQREFCQFPGLVADGRDMGTVVFPNASLKIYLDASSEERARRRYEQLKRKGMDVTIDRIFAEITERDRRDKMRRAAPLKPAIDAVLLDTTHRGIDEVVESVWQNAQQRGLI